MNNREKLTALLADIFLVDPSEIRMDLGRDDLPTWDSLAVVSIAVGVNETFHYHFTPDEATSIQRFQDIIDLLETKGISFNV
jgi:acyl carrier protein